jgi:hypothetical protein
MTQQIEQIEAEEANWTSVIMDFFHGRTFESDGMTLTQDATEDVDAILNGLNYSVGLNTILESLIRQQDEDLKAAEEDLTDPDNADIRDTVIEHQSKTIKVREALRNALSVLIEAQKMSPEMEEAFAKANAFLASLN